ncbi:hypothetical protein LSCM1_04281 [Leishmania martiniquensis]|uniref:Uncharacterized protein n=1 Tax=Leishmania martiniquensis TaxID=1580590 RepID=A0A836GK55_9TRYP|nr:hypothetical protein LSCM1_04281 [Leishmania martiniquensis]
MSAHNGSSSNIFDHSTLPSSQGVAGPYEFTSTAGRHVVGNLRGFRFVEESRTVTQAKRETRSAAASRRRRDI